MNTLILLGKRVIWACKQKKVKPTKQIFLAELKNYLAVLNVCCAIKNSSTRFNGQWGEIFGHLSGLGQDASEIQGGHEGDHGQP